ncbi:hypothetical protein CAPTEDRAFT_166817 [Capitella teleta]|uniref:Protein phosphatase n=1 Tax=Capitella teleta TaxID=283909 RepID=R7TJJ5_CAPTE|nr:hypothetical protein CAPTEDRAFT_166817 [Capitella teleta]|eukprot:ELT91716.1 hypothetical protein CAPTEDRAFT_166817 [Capitella teleta]
MQSLVVYGRLLARAVVSGLNSEVAVSQSSQPSWTPSCSQCTYSRPLHLVTAIAGLSKSRALVPVKSKWSFGDDSCFSASQKLADVVGVADGVGGWREYGIDPSLFPRSLMDTCERLVQRGHFSPSSPKDVICQSYQELLDNKTHLLGSSTVCVVALHREEKKLYSANLGDSGFMVIRSGEVVHRSEEQQHYFNTPFQLSVAPPVLQGSVLNDSPQVADSTMFDVLDGDVILLGTDGLFDNLSDDMILHHIRRLKDHKSESVQNVANGLVKDAHRKGFDPDYNSPFAQHAADNGFHFEGGKPDDVTVILSKVTEGQPPT